MSDRSGTSETGSPVVEPAETPATKAPTGPLDGVLVADFSRVLAGPLTTMWLADLGATVVKVEQEGTGDETRHWGPPWAGPTSSYFTTANRSKLSLAVDLKDPDDLALARELAGRADVMVENFRTGVLARFGLDYDSVSKENPGVVYVSVTGFGSGAGAALPGYDFVVQAVGGLMSITGDPDGDPHKVGVALVDVLTAKDAAIGVLAALQARHRDGVGQHVEVNLLTSLLGSLVNQASSYLTTGVSPGRMGNQHPSIAPYETLHCQDDLLAVACGNDAQFRALCATLGLAEAAVDERYATNAARVAHRATLLPLLESSLSASPAAVWEERLNTAGVPAGRVGSVGSGFAHAAALGLEPLVELPVPHPPQVRHPVTYSRSGVRRPVPPPGLGEDDEVVRAWLIGPNPSPGRSTLEHLETALTEKGRP